jgi:hypothetical protein
MFGIGNLVPTAIKALQDAEAAAKGSAVQE